MFLFLLEGTSSRGKLAEVIAENGGKEKGEIGIDSTWNKVKTYADCYIRERFISDYRGA